MLCRISSAHFGTFVGKWPCIGENYEMSTMWMLRYSWTCSPGWTLIYIFAVSFLKREANCFQERRTFCCERREERDATNWEVVLPIPRCRHKELVFLHLFSGEKRDGDLQDALHEVQVPNGCVRIILAVDIIYDAIDADLSVEKIQLRWLDFIHRG